MTLAASGLLAAPSLPVERLDAPRAIGSNPLLTGAELGRMETSVHMKRRIPQVAGLLFGSGACALVYQVTWLREMRLVFGASTAASAAVLAIFMGGLGLGGALIGRRADKVARPLLLYAYLGLFISASAALTPALLWIVRQLYMLLGGSVTLGTFGGTFVRLVFSTLVLGVPAFLMGGTLPAATRAVETDDDRARSRLAVLYGVNTLGAVAGAALANFFMIEIFGTRKTLWIACLVNALVGVLARKMARSSPEYEARPEPAQATPPIETTDRPRPWRPPARFVLAAAGIVGFAFFLMELVWYRMLAPLLGGSTYTFGLILTVALFGIGLGGAGYAVLGRNRPARLSAFVLSCALEALFIAFPYALGDRLAILTMLLHPLRSVGFGGCLAVWTFVASIVVLPAAIVSGYQFPLLIALLGRGRRDVGRHLGAAYASNTVGAILGSLAGGFGLLPVLTAPGAWCAVVVLLLLLGASTLALEMRKERRALRAVVPGCVMISAVLMLFSTGPTAVWRHSPIGVGRMNLGSTTPNEIRRWVNKQRRTLVWEAEGLESSVGLKKQNGLAFYINGKSDGNAIGDAATQVMSGLVGGILHPQPKCSLVIGLGTGSSAGWLARIPSMERVDVAELEPAVLRVAESCSAVNCDAMANPKIEIFLGDAREFVLTTRATYDIIFSEPSNPYRAGIASLFTLEFYRAIESRLQKGGLFIQWVQAYEIDARTVQTIYATLCSVFPVVETWQAKTGDLLMVCSMSPRDYDVPTLRERIAKEPFKSGLANAWRVTDLEGFLAHYVAGPSLARDVARQPGVLLNTDDCTRIEFEFARTVGRTGLFGIPELERVARSKKEHRLPVTGGKVDWDRVQDERVASAKTLHGGLSSAQRCRADALISFAEGKMKAALAFWRAQDQEPRSMTELAVVAASLAESGEEAALDYIEKLRAFQATEADAILARLRWKQGRADEAVDALESALVRYRNDPWPWRAIMTSALVLCGQIGAENKDHARRIYDAMSEPFSAYALEESRLAMAVNVARFVGQAESLSALDAVEPNVQWRRRLLAHRLDTYAAAGHPRAARAERDLADFLASEPYRFGTNLVAPEQLINAGAPIDVEGQPGQTRAADGRPSGEPRGP